MPEPQPRPSLAFLPGAKPRRIYSKKYLSVSVFVVAADKDAVERELGELVDLVYVQPGLFDERLHLELGAPSQVARDRAERLGQETQNGRGARKVVDDDDFTAGLAD